MWCLVTAMPRHPESTVDPVGRIAFRVPEAAASIGVGRSTIYTAMKSGKLPYFRLPGGRIRIARKALEEYAAGGSPAKAGRR